MTGLDIFAWIVFVVSVICIAGVMVSLAQMPGKTARDRGHPQAEAINLAGWLGLLMTLGVVWVVAMIWARTVQQEGEVSALEVTELKARIVALEKQLNMTQES